MDEAIISCSSAEKVCSIDDLLIQILAGLPLGSLRLLRCVCKRWLSLITDPSFNTRTPNANAGLLFQLQSPDSEFVYVPFNLTTKTKTKTSTCFSLSLSFPYETPSNLDVWQSCNGLLLFTTARPDNKLYVYNPTINKCKLLPPPDVWMPKHTDTRFKLFTALVIAFDPARSPHYKVVYAREDADRLVHLQVYSSQTGLWTPCAQTFSVKYFSAFDRRRGAVYWRGAVHWLSRLRVYHLDVESPGFMFVEDHRDLYGITYGALDRLVVSQSRDCLLLVRVLQSLKKVSVYEMKNEHDYSAGWSVKYHVDLEPGVVGISDDFHVLSLVLGERDEDSFLVLEVSGKNMLLRYNIASNKFHQLCDLSQIKLRDTRYYSFFFTPSLVADV